MSLVGKILALLAADAEGILLEDDSRSFSTSEAGRKARSIAFDIQEKKQLVVDALVELADLGFVATWHPFVDGPARYRITASGRSILLPRPEIAAAFAITFAAFVFWSATTESNATAVRRTIGAARWAGHDRLGDGQDNFAQRKRQLATAAAFGNRRTS